SHVKENSRRSHAPLTPPSSCSRLAVPRRFRFIDHGGTATQRIGYSACERRASKDDRRKRQRHDGSRSQWTKRKQFSGGETRHSPLRRGSQFLLSYSGF